MTQLNWLKEFGNYLSYKSKRILIASFIFISVIPGALIFFFPLEVRLIYAGIFTLLAVFPILSLVQFITTPSLQMAQIWLYSRKHKITETEYKDISRQEIKRMAKKINLNYAKPVYVTDNPFVYSPFVNLLTRKITVPSSWLLKFPTVEIKAAIAHELGHIKYQNKFIAEIIIATFIPAGFTFLFAFTTLTLGLFTLPIILETASLALMVLVLSYVLWRNEYGADKASATISGPEPLISVFQALQQQVKDKSKKDEGSETHPPLYGRIKKLRALLD